jgi:hypothetical protein
LEKKRTPPEKAAKPLRKESESKRKGTSPMMLMEPPDNRTRTEGRGKEKKVTEKRIRIRYGTERNKQQEQRTEPRLALFSSNSHRRKLENSAASR